MNVKEHVNYWLDSAKNDLGAANQLFLSAKYDWCLFIGHLVVEKTLKAYKEFATWLTSQITFNE